MDTSHSYDIVGGPSLDRIFDSFKYAQQGRAFVGVWFSVVEPPYHHSRQAIPVKMENVVINSIVCHDDDNDAPSFDDSGVTDPTTRDSTTPWYEIGGRCGVYSDGKSGDYKRYRFIAYYNPKTRNGYISFYDM